MVEIFDFEQVAKDLNAGCKGHMLNHFGNGNTYTEWTRHDVQIGVDWCYAGATVNERRMCSNCQNVFMKLYIKLVKNYHLCQNCEKAVVVALSNNGFKYQNDKVVSDIVKQHKCEKCS